MLDINYVRENQDEVRAAISNKKAEADLDSLLELDRQRRELTVKVEGLRAEQNSAGDAIAAENDPEKKKTAIEAMRELKEGLKKAEAELSAVTEEYERELLKLPNLPLADVPVGEDEEENVVVRSWGNQPQFDFEPKDHVELAEGLGLLDSKMASQVSGSRFVYLFGDLVRLQYALLQYALSVLTDRQKLAEIINEAGLKVSDRPFVPVAPPLMIRPEVFGRMDRLEPKEERYHLQTDDLYLIGSAEHTLGPLHMDQILKEGELPLRYMAFTAAFRREAGSYGKDTRGIIRQHQFDKIEMESFSLPEDSLEEQNFLVAIQENLLRGLQLPYQVVNTCTGDMGKPDARHIDLECWMPGQGKFRETHSADLMTDYQSRRLGTRVRRGGGEMQFVHMNDATVLAMGRTLVAILENYQQAGGKIGVPEVLQAYLGGQKEIG